MLKDESLKRFEEVFDAAGKHNIKIRGFSLKF